MTIPLPPELILDPRGSNRVLYNLVIQETVAYRGRTALPALLQTSSKTHERQVRMLEFLNGQYASLRQVLQVQFQTANSYHLFRLAWDYRFQLQQAVFGPALQQWRPREEEIISLFLDASHEMVNTLQQRFRLPEIRFSAGSDMENLCQGCIAFLLAMTPTAILARMRETERRATCPTALWLQSFEQPHLPLNLRYAPVLTMPGPLSPQGSVLAWSNVPHPEHTGDMPVTIVQLVNKSAQNIVMRYGNIEDPAEQAGVLAAAHECLAWLVSEPVMRWYTRLIDLHKMAFVALLRHLEAQLGRIGTDDGCFIALNYAMLISPVFVEGYMSRMFPFATESTRGLSPPFPGSEADTRPERLRHIAAFSRFLPRVAGHGGQALNALGVRAAVRYGRERRRW
ncbi:hypothetical protein JCM10908_000113 [Rhodotorula pacifica]|uniref:uncharacterized protein n=1 Tax=Rhodotorula pacifica TaxID=1495444 RepID=UPI00318106D1